MNYEQALAKCAEGARVAAATMLPGQYVEHSFKRGFVRCWPVDKVEEEPQRTQCDFLATDDEIAAEWHAVERPKVDSWGKPVDAAFYASLDDERTAPEEDVKRRRHPIATPPLFTKPEPDKLAVCACGSNIAAAYCCGRPMPAEAVPARDAWGRPIG